MTPRRFSLALGLAALGACLAPSAPGDRPPAAGPPVSPVIAVAAAAHVLDTVFGTPTIQSLAALGPLMRVGAASATSTGAVATAPAVCRSMGVPTPVPAAATPRPFSAVGVPDSLLRHVFAYDDTSGSYHPTGDTSGPFDGVRFLLYAVDGGIPTLPLTRVGWLDLHDQTSAAILALRAQVENDVTRNADYTMTPSGTQSAYQAMLAGDVTTGGHAVTFRDSTGRIGYQVSNSAALDDSGDDVHVHLVASRTSVDPFDNFYDLNVTFIARGQTVRLTGNITTYCLVASLGVTVVVNGRDSATVTNGQAGPNVAGMDGRPLPADQATAILDLLAEQDRVFQWLGVLFAPARLVLPA